MDAKVVGKKLVDFVDEKTSERVRMTKFFLNLPGENVTGFEVGSVSWNEMRNGAAPVIAVGDVIEVEYNKYGRLQFPMLIPLSELKPNLAEK